MLGKEYTFQEKIRVLREREKELRCLYLVEEIIKAEPDTNEFFKLLIKRIPSGWQYPEVCRAKAEFDGVIYTDGSWEESQWSQSAEIVVDMAVEGKISVFYTKSRPLIGDTPFLTEEQKLLNTIAARAGNYIFNRRLQRSVNVLQDQEREEKAGDDSDILTPQTDEHWKWRLSMSEKIAEHLDMEKYGVKGIYLIGSTKTAEAGPASDIDLLIHIGDDCENIAELSAWLEGWSFCLSEVNFSKTGYRTCGLIDVHYVTDEDIMNRTSYAVMIGSTENRARPLRVK